MLLSVVMSVYNGEKYIREQLQSLKSQSRQPDEVLIFDDGSTDNTSEIVIDFIRDNNLKNWQFIKNEVNKGWRRNFIEGMWQAKGDLIFTCDQDDIWRPDKLQIMEEVMKTHPEVKLLTSNYQEFYEDGKTKVGPWKNERDLIKVELPNNYLLVKSPGCTHCIRKEIVELTKKYWRPTYAHDALVWRLAQFADGLYAYTDTLISWRKHTQSAFAKESRDLKCISEKEKWIGEAKKFCKDLHKYIREDVAGDVAKQEKVLIRNDKWLAVRTKFYQTKNPLRGLQLAFYWDCFPRYRQYLGDWYLLFIKRK